MKVLLLILLLLFPSSGLLTAQNASTRPVQPSADPAAKEPIRNINKLSALIGIDVRNLEEERLGAVKELMLDLRSERIVYVVLATGGVLGVGDKLLALPPAALRTGTDEGFIILNADKSALEQASGFDNDNWPVVADATFAKAEMYVAEKPGAEISEAAGAGRDTEPVEPAKPPLGTSMNLIKGSELLGMPVQSEDGEKVGDISDVAVDLKAGRIRYAVLSSGGFLGLGEKLYAVPIETLGFAGQQKTLVLAANKDSLKLAQSFDKTQWPTQADQALASRSIKLRESFGEAAGARRAEPDAEFTLPRHAVHQSGELTAIDQSSEEAELEVTQRLRQSLVGDDRFSFGAKNITIITKGSSVTLRGVVASSEEKQRIHQRAKELAGGREVRDQLTIKTE